MMRKYSNKLVRLESYSKVIVTHLEENFSVSVLLNHEDITDSDYISLTGRNKMYVVKNGKLLHREITKCDAIYDVDHINGDTYDNRKENLRIVTQSQNERNKHSFSRNNTGIIGIQYRKNGNYKYFRVSFRDSEGNRKTKQFNINRYGEDVAFEMAKEYLRDNKKKYEYMTN